ncbi:probable serine/threonine-protein kinase kinX isoform X2 [Macadamia integrifolia]|uniref:probable serine/threonine-protein kinase kinX isoform X2 n=1 Tax=Macadamia integrifolia TaxID=60698 RepID=UPI001C52EA26|nr:probable serine/threonine-protein kinase kinX isoform X2 [Macadamia integrifolia]
MASVGVVPDHSSDEQIEKKGIEELQTVEQGGIPPSSENKVPDGEEEAKAQEESVSDNVPTESEQEVANTQIVPPVVTDAEKVEKFDEAPHSDVPVTDDSQVGVSPDSILDISSVPGSVVEAVEKKTEESPDVTESSVEALEKPVEHLKESPPGDSESEVGKEPEEVSVVERKLVEKPESVVEVERKQQEQSQQFDEKSEMLEPKETVDRDITNDGGTKVDESSKEEISILEPQMVEKPESVVEVVGKPQEAGEVEEKSETLEPKKSINNDGGKDGETQVDESLKEEVSVVEPQTLEKSESVNEMGGKPSEQAGEVEKKSEMLEPKESNNHYGGIYGETQADESLKEEVSVVEPQTREKSESVDEMGGKPSEQAGEVEKNSEILEPKESMDSDVTKDEPTPIEMVKYTEPLKEEEVTKDQDIVASESDTVVCAGQEADFGLKEDGIRSVTPDIVENVSVDDTEKEVGVDGEKEAMQVGECEANKEEKVMNTEESKDLDVKIEELTEPVRTETIEEKEAMDTKIEENEENNVKKEESMLPEPTGNKDVGGSCAATKVAEKSSKEQSASRDAEVVIEEKKEQDAKVDTPDLNGKVQDAKVDTPDLNESKESELEGKVEEAIQSCVDNVDKREVPEETAKSGSPNVELSKIEDNSKTDQEPPKQEVPAKPSQKQSNNIISKVKQSFVKVKKAIIGKSPSSKTLSSAAKGDIQVK